VVWPEAVSEMLKRAVMLFGLPGPNKCQQTIGFIGVLNLPINAVLYFLISPNVGLLFMATTIFYYLNYEILHFTYHLNEKWWISRTPIIKRLRHHHQVHHNKALMNRYNFNVSYPLSDWIFGTTYKPEKAILEAEAEPECSPLS